MKRVGYLFEKICDIENIKKAMLMASKNKRHRKSVSRYSSQDVIEKYAYEIKNILENGEYIPTKPSRFKIYDKGNCKIREICSIKFYPDQCIHWALMLVLTPIFNRGMYEHSCGSVKGRGTGHIHKHVKRIIKKDRKHTKYILKLDVKKFYESITNTLVMESCRKLIKDKKCLNLIQTILGEEDGLEIGYYTSQHFANLVLKDLDHYIKEKLGVKYYFRYIDDMILFGNNKKKLHKCRKLIEEQLSNKDLTLKNN